MGLLSKQLNLIYHGSPRSFHMNILTHARKQAGLCISIMYVRLCVYKSCNVVITDMIYFKMCDPL